MFKGVLYQIFDTRKIIIAASCFTDFSFTFRHPLFKKNKPFWGRWYFWVEQWKYILYKMMFNQQCWNYMLSESAYTLFSKWCHWLPCWEKSHRVSIIYFMLWLLFDLFWAFCSSFTINILKTISAKNHYKVIWNKVHMASQ